MSNNAVTQRDLQRTFIVMLFAFAVSVVAQQIAELFIVATGNWHSDLFPVSSAGNSWAVMLSVATHLLLALLMLTISWVMWSKSKAPGHLEDISEIISSKYVVFLLEILLVTLYFSLAKSVEGDFSAYSKEKTVEAYVTQPSARPEAMQMFWIFVIFTLWDYIVDVLKSPTNPPAVAWKAWLLSQVTGILTYCSLSILCAIGALVVFWMAPINGMAVQAIAGDFALILVLLIFNQGKVLEFYLCQLFPRERTRTNTMRSPTTRVIVTNFLLLMFFLITLLSIRIIPCYLV